MKLRTHILKVIAITLICGLLFSSTGSLMATTVSSNLVLVNSKETARPRSDDPQPAPGLDSTSTSEAASVQPEQTIFVPGNAIAGAEQFVASLQTGDQVTISGISGIVNFNLNPLCTPQAISYFADANGLARSIFELPDNQLCYGNDFDVRDPLTGPNEGHAGLYMMRNAQKTFIGRAGASFTASTNQQLYLGVNDGTGAGSEAPNGGGFNVQVTVTRPTPTLNIGSSTVTEGDTGTTIANFNVALSQASTQTVTVNYATANGTATAPADYVATSGTLTFSPGETSKAIPVTINNDTLDEADENFFINLSSPANATLGVAQGVGTIADNDTPPAIYINDATGNEGNSGTPTFNFTVSLTAASGRSISVAYTTANGTATAGSDYAATSGTITFNPGETSKTIAVPIVADTINENQETFFVNLSNPVNATLADNQGTGTILNDDFPGFFQFNTSTYSVNEAAGTALITVNRVGGSTGTASVSYATSNGTATAGADYTATSGTLSFSNGETSKTFSIPITNDALNEANETVNIALSNYTNGSGPGSPTTATLTIIDGDTPPTISINDISVTEGNSGTTNATFTVSLSAASGRTVTVNYATASVTATSGSDFTPASGTLTFSPGETSKSLTVAVIGDTADEANETFNVNLSNATNASISDAQGVCTINDDEHGALQFSASNFTVNESAGNATITVTRTGGADGTVTVHYATSGGTAVANTDFTPTSGTLTFNQGETSKTFAVPIVNDTLDEANETVNLALTSPTGGVVLGAQSAATLTILDDDATPSLSINDASVIEGNSGSVGATFTVTLSAVSGRLVTVAYATVDGTATANSDYLPTSGVLTFSPGEKTKTIMVAVNGDLDVEPNETFFVSLNSPSNATIVDGQGVGTITNDDSAGSLQFSAANYSVNENAGNATISVTRTGGSNGTVTVQFATGDGSALAGSDYTTTTGTLSFAAGETSKSFNVPITNDAVDEPTETINLALSNPTGGGVLGVQHNAVLSIIDNDSAPTLSINDISVVEGNSGSTNALFTVTMSSISGQPVTVNYATANGTATAGSDYTAASGTLTFNPGETARTIPIAISGDTDVESNETFFVNLSGAANASIARAQGQGTITNDDHAGQLQFSTRFYFANENDGSALITVTRTGGSTGAVTVHYATSDGTAVAGQDYTASSGTLSFAVGETSKSFNVPIIDDAIDEVRETVHLALTSPSGGATLGEAANATLTIVDNDAPLPTISVSNASVVEGNSGAVKENFAVTLSSASTQSVSVVYATSDGTATAGSDYGAVSGTLVFGPGETSRTVSVFVNGDTTVEPDETFTLNLSNPVNASIGNSQGLGTILNDDSAGALQFSAASYAVNESGGSISINVTRTNGSSGAVNVDYATSNGTATAGSDYTSASGTLSFADGETSKSFVVPVTNDNSTEGNETINLALTNPTGGATLGTPNTAVLTILDNNPAGQLQFSAPTYSVNENGVSATITVARVGGTNGAVSVQYATSDGTATAGSDYSPASGTLNFGNGETSKNFSITITDDTIAEGAETVTLTLSNPSGGASLGAQSAAILTIIDDDFQPAISIDDGRITEGNSGVSNLTLVVSLSSASSLPVSVDYETVDETANSGSDYQPSSGTIIFEPGETSKTITVLINGDTEPEADETFVVNLTNAVGATLHSTSGRATIINDDATGEFSFSASTYSVREDAGEATITVTRSGDTSGGAAVDYSTLDGVASQRSDYTIAAGSLSFAPGETSKTFNVLVTEDAYNEGSESLTLMLNRPTGGVSLGATSTATLVIFDGGDGGSSSINTIDDTENFVRQHYHDFLNREPDSNGLQFWTNQIESCGADLQCRDVKRVNVSAAFFLSIEFQQTGYFAYRMYKTAYGNLPQKTVSVVFSDLMRDTQQLGHDVIVGQGAWEQQIVNNKTAFTQAFVNRNEFLTRYPATIGAAEFVTSINANAGDVLSDSEKAALIDELSANPIDSALRADVLRKVVENTLLQRRESSRAFVLMQYFGYLRRNPDDAPDTDFGGYNYWLNKLEAFNGDYVGAEMIKAFISSTEYRRRFGER